MLVHKCKLYHLTPNPTSASVGRIAVAHQNASKKNQDVGGWGKRDLGRVKKVSAKGNKCAYFLLFLVWLFLSIVTIVVVFLDLIFLFLLQGSGLHSCRVRAKNVTRMACMAKFSCAPTRKNESLLKKCLTTWTVSASPPTNKYIRVVPLTTLVPVHTCVGGTSLRLHLYRKFRVVVQV